MAEAIPIKVCFSTPANKQPSSFWRLYALICLTILLVGCSTSSLFRPYPDQAQSFRQAAQSADYQASERILKKRIRSRDKLLYLQERGRLAQISGDIEQSRKDFEDAIGLYQEHEEAARIRLGETGAGASSLAVNDNALRYRGQDYERIMLHSLQALNFWQDKDFTGAAVEFRRATEEQNMAQRKREREIQKAEKTVRENDIQLSSIEQELGGLNTAAASVRNSIENAYAYYLAGVFREGTGDYNNAIVDYKRAYEINPKLSLLPNDIKRVESKQNGYRSSQVDVVVVYEQGLIPPRQEVNLPIPTRHGYFSVAFPTYSAASVPMPPLRVQSGGKTVQTETAAYLGAMAARALKEQIPGMLVRQVLRAKLKYETQKTANEELGAFGAITAQLYNLLSERADLRSWLTLPATAQVARFTVPPGERVINLSGQTGNARVNIKAKAGSTVLLRVIDGQHGKLNVTTLPILETSR